MNLCDVENKHLIVQDVFTLTGRSMITDAPRTVPGDCYCTRCGQAVPFWFNSRGEPFPAAHMMASEQYDRQGRAW